MQNRRSHISNLSENCDFGVRLHKQSRTTTMNQHLRAPFAVLVQNSHNINNLPAQHHVNITKEVDADGISPQLKTFWFGTRSCTYFCRKPEKHTTKKVLRSDTQIISQAYESLFNIHFDEFRVVIICYFFY